jgi:hypothetical protein
VNKSCSFLLLGLGLFGMVACGCNRAPSSTSGPNASSSGPTASETSNRRAAKHEQKFESMLDRVREKPDSRKQVIERLTSRLDEKNVANREERVKEINRIFDQALAMDEQKYQRDRERLARKLRRQVREGHDASEPVADASTSPRHGHHHNRANKDDQGDAPPSPSGPPPSGVSAGTPPPGPPSGPPASGAPIEPPPPGAEVPASGAPAAK